MQLTHAEIRHAPWLGPPINHRPHTPRPAIRPHRIGNLQPVQQGFAGIPRSLGDDAHPTVVQIRGTAGQPQLVGLAIHPPPKPDPLHIAMHPRRQPHHVTAHASSLATPRARSRRDDGTPHPSHPTPQRFSPRAAYRGGKSGQGPSPFAAHSWPATSPQSHPAAQYQSG